MVRLYVMPLVGAGTKADPRKPKYASILNAAAVEWAAMDYGIQPVCLIAGDVPDATHTQLIANADVTAFPDNFQNSGATAGNQANAVQSALESFSIPAQWVGAQDTYLSIAHTVGVIFQLMQRLNGILGNVNPFAGVTLNTKISGLSATIRQALTDAATSFGWDTSGISGNTTIRQAFKLLADQWGATPLYIGPFTI